MGQYGCPSERTRGTLILMYTYEAHVLHVNNTSWHSAIPLANVKVHVVGVVKVLLCCQGVVEHRRAS